MGKPWEDYKEEIHELYIRQNLPLKEVQEILKTRYNFEACKRAFQNQIEAWGFRKNVRSSEMQVYVQQKKLRKSDSEIDLPDETKKIITPRKARRFEKRSESLNQHKATSLDLETGAISSMGIPAHHHHHQPSLHSPSYPQHRMTMGSSYPGFPQYTDETLGCGPSFPSTSSAPGHEMPKYAGMTISLCDDANPGSFSIPVTRSPYDNSTYINPAITTTAYAPAILSEAPMFDLTGDYTYQSGMHYGALKKNLGSDWYAGSEDLHVQVPSVFQYAASDPIDSELLTLCFSGAVRDIRVMLEKGANTNAVSVEGDTPLTCVVKGILHTISRSDTFSSDYLIKYLLNYNKVLDLLLKSGADPTQANRMHEFPLQILASKNFLNDIPMPNEVRKQFHYFCRQLSSAVNQNQQYTSYLS